MGRLAWTLLTALAAGAIPRPAAADPSPGWFIDTRGVRTELGPVYDGWFGDDRPPPHYLRAVVENAGLLGFELCLYWYDPQGNRVDWQFTDMGRRLTSSDTLRFDDNPQGTNWLVHPMAGSAHYGFTRANEVGVAGSLAAAVLSSAVYEIALEWREVVSINDLIVTPLGGMALGEFLFHLGDYLNSASSRPRRFDEVVGPAPFGRALSAGTLGFARALHNVADAPPPPPAVPEDELGLSSAYAHRFRLLLGQEVVRDERGRSGHLSVVSAHAELAAMPGFLRPGRMRTWFSSGSFTSMDLRVGVDDRVRDLDLHVDAHLFGHFAQTLDATPGGVTGTARELGAHTALHYVDRSLLDRRDRYAVLHVLGPVATLWLAAGPTMVRLSADVTPDFAAPRSLAFGEWRERFGGAGAKSSLLAHSYHHAWGGSAGASATLSSRGLTAAGQGRYGRYESIDGAEREREPVTREVHATDEILELAGSVAYEPPRTRVSAGVTLAHVARRSTVPPLTTGRADQRIGMVVGVRF